FTEDVDARFEAYGWHVARVEDGNDLAAIEAAIEAARAEKDRPSLIVVRTIIGYGSPNKADTADVHGSPLGEDEVRRTKENLGWPVDATFHVPEAALEKAREAVEQGARQQAAWIKLKDGYRGSYPDLGATYDAFRHGVLPEGWEDAVPVFDAGSSLATRAASGKVLDALVPAVGFLVGGSADLTGSNKTRAKAQEGFQKDNPAGRYLFFGVREHAMASACNGISLHGGLRAYCGTFLIFSDYLRPAMRLSALMGEPVIYVFTHDSIGLGEDGPTHQAVEHYMALRAIPNLTFIRPGDANETAEAWKAALLNTDGPTALALTRQNLPTLDRDAYAPASGLQRGAYVLRDADDPELILMATGSEVQLVVAAAERLADDGVRVRVVSMPSWELFEAQPQTYRDGVLPPSVRRRVAVEAGVTLGWGRYVGPEGRVLGLDRFGTSAPAEVAFERLGFTVDNVVGIAREVLGR
ncbi:MAG: transketolase, partial [Rhodothermales bacterium]|nr:transketolase [Rhodothermales bacterium]